MEEGKSVGKLLATAGEPKKVLHSLKGKFLKISNKGLIDVNAFKLIGASTKKDDDTKIGFFGSGLKYAIAWLMRNGSMFKVFVGDKEIKFTTRKKKLAQHEFDVIYVNGGQTSLTTELGAQWEEWFAIREIYCNALDEGAGRATIVEEIAPYEDETAFYIPVTLGIKELFDHWGQYFSEARKDLEYALVRDSNLEDFIAKDLKFKNKLFKGGDELIIYRKGIQCYRVKKKCLFHYDMDFAEINESRVMKSMWDFEYKLVRYLKQYASRDMIEYLLKNMHGYWEEKLDWDNASYTDFNDNWKDALKEQTIVSKEYAGHYEGKVDLTDVTQVPDLLVKQLKAQYGDEVHALGYVGSADNFREEVVVLDPKHEYLLKDVMQFLEQVKYTVGYPIKVCTFGQPNKLGQAADDTIWLSEKLFDLGRKEIAMTIVEENEHLVSGLKDETRAFQNHFINKYITSLEERYGHFL